MGSNLGSSRKRSSVVPLMRAPWKPNVFTVRASSLAAASGSRIGRCAKPAKRSGCRVIASARASFIPRAIAQRQIQLYSDYKSPYAYLAKDLAYELEHETGVQLDWLPYTLDIPAYLGNAKVDAQGHASEESRNAHQWRRVKYSYMDCRREANRRGLTIRR